MKRKIWLLASIALFSCFFTFGCGDGDSVNKPEVDPLVGTWTCYQMYDATDGEVTQETPNESYWFFSANGKYAVTLWLEVPSEWRCESEGVWDYRRVGDGQYELFHFQVSGEWAGVTVAPVAGNDWNQILLTGSDGNMYWLQSTSTDLDFNVVCGPTIDPILGQWEVYQTFEEGDPAPQAIPADVCYFQFTESGEYAVLLRAGWAPGASWTCGTDHISSYRRVATGRYELLDDGQWSGYDVEPVSAGDWTRIRMQGGPGGDMTWWLRRSTTAPAYDSVCGGSPPPVGCATPPYEGITPLDANGVVLGTPDPNDWGCLGGGSGSGQPTNLCWGPAFPNPATAAVTLPWTLPEAAMVTLQVYGQDDGGRAYVVRTLSAEPQVAGWHQVNWDLKDDAGMPVAPGIYRAMITADGQTLCGDIQVP